ncbi:hypothetical protein IscW_ISCW022518 [Ixodes scapularis]|uniref:Reelin domain-containing protein n=1 Tax=Ixodes scapularis TaxID=6945 RepID=B7QG64_IXOSC|nr:hypothetical protein IscW_ISCW022518 [Ixodes scapularis]|eukprot:XP_002401222.1 hypothetical protein IscW_ISCW022518 [Ixodes scapularis]
MFSLSSSNGGTERAVHPVFRQGNEPSPDVSSVIAGPKEGGHGSELATDRGANLALGVPLLRPLASDAGLQQRRWETRLCGHDAQAQRAPAEHPPPVPGEQIPPERDAFLAPFARTLPVWLTPLLVERKEGSLQITLMTTNRSLGFRGFLIRALRVRGSSAGYVRGNFAKDPLYQNVRFIRCDVNENSAVTHTDPSLKQMVVAHWSPFEGTRETHVVFFREKQLLGEERRIREN